MAVLPIRTFGDPVLKEKARPVESFDDALRRLAEDMIETMHDAPGVGLAAPQVGRSLRLIAFDVGEEDGGPRAVANPRLFDEWGEELLEEGCLSVPGLYYPLRRFAHVQAEGFDLEGNEISIEGEGLLARVLQHEVDHLNGVLFLDRLEGEDRKQALVQLREQAMGLRPPAPDPSRSL